MGNHQRPSQSIRWAIFAVVLVGFAGFILTQPYQNQSNLFVVLVPVSIVLGAFLLSPQRFDFSAFSTPGDVLPAGSVATNTASTEVVTVGSYPLETIPASQEIAIQGEIVTAALAEAEETPDERWKKALILAAALVMMFVGQLQIFRDPPNFPTSTSFVLILLGLAIFFVTMNAAVLDGSEPAAPQPVPVLRLRWRWLAASVGLAAFAAWRNSIDPAQAYLSEYVLVMGLCVVCFTIAVRPVRRTAPPHDTNPLRRWEYFVMIGLFAVALFIRGVNLNTEPRLFDNDEGNVALSGEDIRAVHFLVNPFTPGYVNLPLTTSVLIGLSTTVFGETPAAARIPGALFGALTIPALYVLGRELFGWRIGLIASLFMLTWALHIQISRIALPDGDIFFGTLALYFLVLGLRRARAMDYVWCGVALALSQLFYPMGRQIPIIMVAYLVYLWLRERSVVARQWRLLLIIPLMAFLVLLPQNYHMYINHEDFFENAKASIITGGQLSEQVANGDLVAYFFNQAKASVLGLFSQGDQAVYYGLGSNYMGPVGGPPLLIGVVMSLLVIWKRPRWSLPLGWGLSTLLFGGILAISPPQYQRLASGAPAFALLVALGVETIGRGFADVLQNRQLLAKVGLGMATALCAANLAFYVGVFVPEQRYLSTRQNWGANRASADIVSKSQAGVDVVLLAGGDAGISHQAPVLDFLTKGLPFIDNEYPDQLEAQLANFDPQKPFIFIVTPDRKTELDTLMTRYPGGSLAEVHLDEDGSLGYYTYSKGTGQSKSVS